MRWRLWQVQCLWLRRHFPRCWWGSAGRCCLGAGGGRRSNPVPWFVAQVSGCLDGCWGTWCFVQGRVICWWYPLVFFSLILRARGEVRQLQRMQRKWVVCGCEKDDVFSVSCPSAFFTLGAPRHERSGMSASTRNVCISPCCAAAKNFCCTAAEMTQFWAQN